MEIYTTGGAANADVIYPNTILIPTNDDFPANAETVRAGFAALADRTRQLQNFVQWHRPRVAVRCDDGAHLIFETLGGVAVYDEVNDQWFLFRAPFLGTQISLNTAGLANSTWYYVYAKQTAGALDFDVNTTAPDAILVGKGASGDTRFRYLLCFRTDGSGNIVPFRYQSGHFRYYQNQGAAPLTSLANTSFTTLSLAALVPPHVLMADLFIYHINNTGLQKTLAFRHTGTSLTDTYYMPSPNGEFDYRVTRALNASQQLDAKIDSGANLYSIVVEGFREQT